MDLELARSSSGEAGEYPRLSESGKQPPSLTIALPPAQHRNIQPHVPALYPYLDSRCLNYAWQVGLTRTSAKDKDEDVDILLEGADELRHALEASGSAGQDDKAQRLAYVRLVNVLIGLGLEGQLDKAREHVGAQTANGKEQ